MRPRTENRELNGQITDLRAQLNSLQETTALQISFVEGDTIPDTPVVGPAGETATLSELVSRGGVIAFLTTTCPYCKEMLPVWAQLSEQYAARGVPFDWHSDLPFAIQIVRLHLDPFSGVRSPERRTLTRSERSALMDADGPFTDYWRTYLLTGMRRSELISMTLDRVHLNSPAPFITVIGKGLKKRDLPVEGRAREIFSRLVVRARQNSTLMICPISDGQIAHRWNSDRARIGLPTDIRLHDLRHDFISVLANSGTPLPVVQRLAGHSQLATTAAYIHDDPAALRAAMAGRSDAVYK